MSNKKFIVQTRYVDEPIAVELLYAHEIVARESMSDCSGGEMCVWEPGAFGELTKLRLHGTWHDVNDPPYIKATRPDGTIAFDGYGVDH